MVKVIKRSGKEEEFLEDKVYNSLINAGASEEVAKQIVKELKEDMKYGLSPKTVNARLYALFIGVLRKKDMSKEEKIKSIELINNFRKEMRWKPYELKQPIQ